MPNAISEVEFQYESQQQDTQNYISGRWRSKAILQAMEGVKRTEMFEHLRKANDSNTITKKFSVMNASPNILIKAKQLNDIPGTMSQRLPHM